MTPIQILVIDDDPLLRKTLVDLLGRIDTEFVEFAPVFKMARPSKSLVDCFHEAAATPA